MNKGRNGTSLRPFRVALPSPRQQILAEQRQRRPDQHETAQLHVPERLMEHRQAEDKDKRRRDELDEAHGRIIHGPRGMGKQQERQRRRQPRGRHQQIKPDIAAKHYPVWASAKIDQRHPRHRQDRRLHRQPWQSIDGHQLAYHAIGRKAQREEQADQQC